MSTASDIVKGLGGRDNITDLEPCITRLRVEVVDQEKVDEEALRAAGAFGVVRSGRVVQVVVGPLAGAAHHLIVCNACSKISCLLPSPTRRRPEPAAPQSAQRGPDAAVPPHPRISA